jgi:hypothetical protein
MTEHTTPVTIARAFTEAWANHDMETAASYLAEEVVFVGPIAHSRGLEDYLKGLTSFARAVRGVKVLAAFGDDTQALVMYDLMTGPLGTLTGAELLTFRDGNMSADRLTFDPFPIRGGAATGQPPSGAAPTD